MLATLLFSLAAVLAAQELPPIPEGFVDDVTRAERVGRELYLDDVAAARGTEALLAKTGSLDELGLAGYLTVREHDAAGKPADAWMVLFLSQSEPPNVLYRVHVESGEKAPEVLDAPKPPALPADVQPLWSARALAIEKGGPYEQPINPVVLRGKDVGGEGILVYLLAGTDKPDVAVLGRHVRVRTDDQGRELREVTPLTKSVIEIPTTTPEGKPVAMLTVSQVLTDTPTEAHVFASLAYGLAIAVRTEKSMWKVADGTIRYLGPVSRPGLATLQLSLRAPDGKPCAGKLDLWRVGIPAEPGFTAGDDRIGDFDVPLTGLSLPDLTPGSYRVVTDAHAALAPDLAAFEVKAPRTGLVLDVVPPREREAFVDLVDVTGKPFATAEYKSGGGTGSSRRPAWAKQRAKIEEDGTESIAGYGGRYARGISDNSYVKIKRAEHGLPIGRDTEDSQLWESTRSITLRVEHGMFSGTLRCDTKEEPRFRALVIEKGRFEGLFTLPDGSPLDLERLHVSTPLMLEGELLAPDWWLDVPVTVRINAFECKPLTIEFKLRDGMPKARKLEALH